MRMRTFEVVRIENLDRGVTFFGIYMNTGGIHSRVLELSDIKRRLGAKISALSGELTAYLDEKGAALFETEQAAREIAKLLNF